MCYNIIRGDIMRDLKNYEDLYLITEDGVIYSKDKVCYNPRYGKYIRKGKKIKTTLKRGYLTCVINGEMKCVHRLLYETYVSDIPYDCVIHHINEEFDKLNSQNRIIITTEKDGSRLKHHKALTEQLKPFIYLLPIEIEILRNQQAIFNQNIVNYVRTYPRNCELPKK